MPDEAIFREILDTIEWTEEMLCGRTAEECIERTVEQWKLACEGLVRTTKSAPVLMGAVVTATIFTAGYFIYKKYKKTK